MKKQVNGKMPSLNKQDQFRCHHHHHQQDERNEVIGLEVIIGAGDSPTLEDQTASTGNPFFVSSNNEDDDDVYISLSDDSSTRQEGGFEQEYNRYDNFDWFLDDDTLCSEETSSTADSFVLAHKRGVRKMRKAPVDNALESPVQHEEEINRTASKSKPSSNKDTTTGLFAVTTSNVPHTVMPRRISNAAA